MIRQQDSVQDRATGAFDSPTLGAHFDHIVALHPNQVAVICHEEGVLYTWQELQSRVDQLAIGLLSTGLQKGDRVALCASNRAEWLVVQLACSKAGFVLVSIAPSTRPPTLVDYLNATLAKALILEPSRQYLDGLTHCLPEILAPKLSSLTSPQAPALQHLITLGPSVRSTQQNAMALPDSIVSIDSIIDRGAKAETMLLSVFAKDMQSNDICAIQLPTPNNANPPKALRFSHHDLLHQAHLLNDELRLMNQDKIFLLQPTAANLSTLTANTSGLSQGCTLVYPGCAYPTPSTVLALLQDERCTGLYGTSENMEEILAHPELADFDLSALRFGIVSGTADLADLTKKLPLNWIYTR